MADTNKKKLKVGRFDALNPFKLAQGAYRVVKSELKKKNKYKSTGKGNQHLNFNKPEGKKDHNKQFASFRKNDVDQAKLNKQVANNEKVTYERVTKKNKDKLSNQHKVKSKSSNTGKKMGRTERENRKRFGDAHVDKLKARHKAFKEARRKKKK